MRPVGADSPTGRQAGNARACLSGDSNSYRCWCGNAICCATISRFCSLIMRISGPSCGIIRFARGCGALVNSTGCAIVYACNYANVYANVSVKGSGAGRPRRPATWPEWRPGGAVYAQLGRSAGLVGGWSAWMRAGGAGRPRKGVVSGARYPGRIGPRFTGAGRATV